MSFYKDPSQTLLKLIGDYNNLTLAADDYDFSAPTPASPPAGSDATYNTAITLSSNKPAAPYIGEVEIFYNRLSLADLDTLANIYIYADQASTTYDIIEPLNTRYGLSLSQDDLEDLPVEDNGNYVIATLRAKSTSLGWLDEVQIPVALGDLLLENHLTQTTLEGLKYPTEDTSRPYAYFYSYWRDFSDYYEQLEAYTTEDVIDVSIVSIMNDVTGDVWVGTGTAEFSLELATIIYNGPVVSYPASNQRFDNVMVIALNAEKCTGLSGDLIIHYAKDPYQVLGI